MVDAATNTPTHVAKCELPVELRVTAARLQSKAKVSANNVGTTFDLLTSVKPGPTFSRQTSTRCLVEAAQCCIDELARDLSSCANLALGCDGSGTFFDRHGFEVHVSWEGGTELLDLVDLIDKSAEGCLNCILLIWGRLNDIQRELAVPPTPLYAIRTLYADNASVNTGVAGGLAALLDEARKAAHARDDPATLYHPLKFKGCDHHILALVLT